MKYFSLNTFFSTLTVLGVFFVFSGNIFAAESICGGQEGYELYECRVENICAEYKSPKPTYQVTDYLSGEELYLGEDVQVAPAYELDEAMEIYRENMGNIYKCAMIQGQKNTLTFLGTQLKQESSGQLSDTLGGQIESRINRLELTANTLKCVLTDTETIQNKLNILKETTHELCRYTNYLEYLKEYISSLEIQAVRYNNGAQDRNNLENFIDRSIGITELPDAINSIQQEIAVEQAHSYKVFPLAYHAYSQYENNFPVHFLLEAIRSDFLIVRNRFYGVLMPLAQLGYKVINAMSY
ncbi:hypothetical protein N9J72_02355 [Candidatus Gracilibacteria bacterium]|nr:hypothetical protein [Candidatus Gracilibacteria bacterium]